MLKLLEFEKSVRGINSVSLPVSASSVGRYRINSYVTLSVSIAKMLFCSVFVLLLNAQELIRNDMEIGGNLDERTLDVLNH